MRTTFISTCPECGKRRYASRADARRSARRQPQYGRMSAYRCGDYWHLGHLPKAIARGRYDRDCRPAGVSDEQAG